MFSVLYTHQKAKKSKTWQDGILKVIGNKALLCDEESKTLDAFFLHNDQVTPGDELESDRYLITIEERLHSISDHTQGVTSETAQKKEVKDTKSIYQPGKRKRQCFLPTRINEIVPMVTRCIEPEGKKPRKENIPQIKHFATANRPPSKNEFFNMYSVNNRESESNYIHQPIQRDTPYDGSPSVLQTSNSQAMCAAWQRPDQIVPFNATPQGRVAGEDNQLSTTLTVPSSSRIQLRNENLHIKNKGLAEGKRSTSQILALFSPCNNNPQPQTVDSGENKKAHQANIEVNGRSHCSRLHGTVDRNSSQTNPVKFSAHPSSVSGTIRKSQTNLAENADSHDQELVMSEDLSESLNLSPDSFVACFTQAKAESPCNLFREGRACEVAVGDAVPDSNIQSPDDSQSNDVWLLNNSESVSPLMRQLTSVDKDLTEVHSGAAADFKEKIFCDLTTDRSQQEYFNIQNPDSPPVEHVLIQSPDSPPVKHVLTVKHVLIQSPDSPPVKHVLIQSPDLPPVKHVLIQSPDSPPVKHVLIQSPDSSPEKRVLIQSPDSSPAKNVLCPSLDPCLLPQSPRGCDASLKTISDTDMVEASPLSEQNQFDLRPETNVPSAGINTKDVSLKGFKNMPGTQSRSDYFSIETKEFSGHPGSLFAYSALQSQEKNNFLERYSDESLHSKRCGKLELWDTPLGTKGYTDTENSFLDSGLSPEFYPPGRDTITQWRVAPVVTNKVIPTDSRTVRAGNGHSWKGSVVSDTVKRGCPVQSKQLTAQTGHGNRRAPSSDLTGWIDAVSSTNIRDDSQCLMSSQAPGGFATSESIALSSTDGFKKDSQLSEQNFTVIPEFVRRVPQLSRRRAPILTAPPEDHDTQHTVPYNVHYTGTCSTKSFPGLCHEETAETVINRHGPFLREAKAPYGSAKLHLKGKETKNSVAPGACRRVGLRRVGLGNSGDFPKNQNAVSQMRQQLHRRPVGYRPPTAPGFMADSLSGDRTMAGELCFPSAEECDSSVTPTRHVTVPVTFENVMQYRQVFKAALREHLNIVLFELARSYYSALQKVDVSQFDAHQQGSVYVELARSYYSALQKVDVSQFDAHQQGKRQSSEGPSCPHGQARLRAVKKDGPNKGRLFYSCPGTGQAQCKFFKWADEYQANNTGSKAAGQKSTSKLTLSSPDSLMSYLKSHNVAFYCECHLIRKHTDTGKRRFSAAKTKKWGRQRTGEDGNVEGSKKGLYLELPRKEHSSTYSKDDIWIISKNLAFNQESTFIASSAYYGPSSSGELEILPISGYSPSNWTSGEIVHALMACNAGTELTCISNIEEHVKLQNMPVLPYILHSREQTLQPNIRSTSRASSFVSPMQATSGGQLDLPLEVTESLAEEMIARFNLNKDQAAALLSCAKMFNSSVDNYSPSLPVCLIHGVFGAGKSFLLAVVVLYLVELFKVSDSFNNQSNASSQLKILVSSTTNVAVDRILLGLLELGFEEFVRVGSIRKIAKPVLPYSVHSTGSDSQELRELQALLKAELTPSERNHVRKSIERHKQGENKNKLSQVRVVGVTCAACVFPCLDKLKFPVLLLDECSQMTEPASLLPMARFECQKLVLVGDPKQLSPTIQGSEPEHDAGLEQTLFDRLMKMGYEPTLLRTQYRCHPAISAIPNRLFYQDKLLDGVTAEDRPRVVDIVPTLCFYNVARGREKCGSDGSYFNEEEAKFVVFLIERLLESGVEPAQVGVITLYKSQLHTIANNLTASRTTSHAELKAIQISTVDAFQGGEKDLIILSCVRTDHIGFIDCDRRTNVALTRAKRHLLIVGNLKMLSCNAVWGKVIEHCLGRPDGLCNSQDFMKKWQEEESIDLREGPVIVSPEETAKHPEQINGVKEPNALEVTSDSPPFSTPFTATSSAKGLGTEQDVAQPYKENASCLHLVDIRGIIDGDSDVELPTFDLVSSLGI